MHLPCGDSSSQINKDRLPNDWVLRRYIVSTIRQIKWCTERIGGPKISNHATAINNSSSPLRSVGLSFYVLRRTTSSLFEFEWRRRHPVPSCYNRRRKKKTHPRNNNRLQTSNPSRGCCCVFILARRLCCCFQAACKPSFMVVDVGACTGRIHWYYTTINPVAII